MDTTEAEGIATRFLGQPEPDAGFQYVILDDYTIERARCFVFFYESSRYLKSEKFEDRLAGNSPILVEKETGKPHWLGTSRTVEYYIAEFETRPR